MEDDRVMSSGAPRDADTEEKQKAAPDNPAPFSDALGIPTLIGESTSAPEETANEKRRYDQGAPKPTIAPDDPAPFSEALGIPTLIGESKRREESRGDGAPGK